MRCRSDLRCCASPAHRGSGRFHPDYRAIYRLFGWRYQGTTRTLPRRRPDHLRWVYGPVLPEDLLGEIRNRKGISQKHHQWLSDQGLAHLESQIHAVTAIARSSMSYRRLQAPLRIGFRWRCRFATRPAGRK